MLRITRLVFGTLAGLLLMAALANVVLDGRLSVMPPAAFGSMKVGMPRAIWKRRRIL